ncbi:MAG: hypothetical protein ACT4QC_17765 [Planctomycetaceae bacterium]
MNAAVPWLSSAAVVVAVGLIAWLGRRPVRAWWQRREIRQAVLDFRRHRETLEAKFFDLAAASGKPRGLRWVDIDWLDLVTYGRDRQTGLLTAFAAINIRFEAVEGGDMEGVAAVDNIRDGAAVFHYQRGQWGTGGRALFNMNPADALVRLEGQYEPVRAG